MMKRLGTIVGLTEHLLSALPHQDRLSKGRNNQRGDNPGCVRLAGCPSVRRTLQLHNLLASLSDHPCGVLCIDKQGTLTDDPGEVEVAVRNSHQDTILRLKPSGGKRYRLQGGGP